MAGATITRAVTSGLYAVFDATMAADQPDAGAVYTVQVLLEDLRTATTTAARKALVDAALTTERAKQTEKQTKIDTFLAGLVGKTTDI